MVAVVRPSHPRRFAALILALGLAGVAGGDARAQGAAPAAQAKKPAAGQPAATPEAGSPQATTATYGDWVVRCVSPQPQAPRICEAVTGIQAQGQPGLLAQVVVGRVAKDQPVRLIVQLPAGVFLPPGATLYLDEKAQSGIGAVFSSCPRGCFADVELKADQLAALKAAKGPGRVEFADGSRNRVALPISFEGLSPAIDAALNPKD